jgi:DNA-binding response OmpR family regulator
LAHRKNIQLETEVDPHLKNTLKNDALSFYFDDDIVEKILFNLLYNAFKFTPEGGCIVVSISLPRNEKNFLELKVEDNGAGIPADKLPFIFDRFYQADNSSQRQYEGSGIGLSLVKELVELHEGKITVKSTLNEGTAFSCYLPLNKKIVAKTTTAKLQQPQPVPAFIHEENSTPATASTAKGEPVVLLVEDQQDVRKYIREKLVNHYKVLEAKNGIEGLTIAKEQMPDLVISDVMMPKMDGFELCKQLKTDNLTSHVPVILLTARAEEADKLNGLEIGADAYLIKPFNARELQIRVSNLIEIRNKMRAKFSQKLTVKPSEIAVTSRDRLFMQQLLTITEQHIGDETFSVEQLGREVNMSASQINRKLKALVNQSAQQFIRSVRMQRALELLKNKGGTVAEVAYRVGFGDPGYFTRVFKTYFGYSPSELKSE